MTKTKLCRVDTGNCGSPGSPASEEICEVYLLSDGRYEAICWHSTGSNQGYYQENYSYGSWRGRGETVEEAISEMLNVVPDGDVDHVRNAAREAQYEAEDALSDD